MARALKVAVQMDPIQSIDIDADSTFALMLEAQERRTEEPTWPRWPSSPTRAFVLAGSTEEAAPRMAVGARCPTRRGARPRPRETSGARSLMDARSCWERALARPVAARAARSVAHGLVLKSNVLFALSRTLLGLGPGSPVLVVAGPTRYPPRDLPILQERRVLHPTRHRQARPIPRSTRRLHRRPNRHRPRPRLLQPTLAFDRASCRL